MSCLSLGLFRKVGDSAARMTVFSPLGKGNKNEPKCEFCEQTRENVLRYNPEEKKNKQTQKPR